MQIRALQPHAGAGASALPLQSTGTAARSCAGAEICMCEIEKKGNHRSKTPGGPLATKERARCTTRPASGRSASMTSRTRPLALSGVLKDSGGGGFLRDQRLLRRAALAARPGSSPRKRAGRRGWERGRAPAARLRPQSRVGGGASDVSSGKSPVPPGGPPRPLPLLRHPGKASPGH